MTKGLLYAGSMFIASGVLVRHCWQRGAMAIGLDAIAVGLVLCVVAGVWWAWWVCGGVLTGTGGYSVFCEQCGKSIAPGDPTHPVVDIGGPDESYYCSTECSRLHTAIESKVACPRCYSEDMVSCEICGKPCCMNEECMYCPECDYQRSK